MQPGLAAGPEGQPDRWIAEANPGFSCFTVRHGHFCLRDGLSHGLAVVEELFIKTITGSRAPFGMRVCRLNHLNS